MSCPDIICRLVTCEVTDDIPSYLGSYSLQNGTFFTNQEIFIRTPTGFYIVPAGTINISVPPNPTSISYQGCQSGISVPVPSGASQAVIQQIVSDVMQQAAVQLSICNAPPNPHNPSNLPLVNYQNSLQSAFCGDPGPQMNLVGVLPSGVIFTIDSLSIVAGVFTSTVSQLDADVLALTFLNSLIEGGVVECGWWNEAQTCPNMSIIPANTFFSTVSQEDANDLALASCPPACNIDWTLLAWGVPSYTVHTNVTESMTPVSTTGAVFTMTWDVTNAASWIGIIRTGVADDGALLTVNPAAPGCNCNIHLSIDRNYKNTGGESGTLDLNFDISLNTPPFTTFLSQAVSVPDGIGIVTFDIPFSLPNTGSPYQIALILNTQFAGSFSSLPKFAHLTGTISNV